MDNVVIAGIEQLNNQEKEQAEKIIFASYEKIKRKTKIDFLFKIDIKIPSKDKENLTKRRRYSINATISGAVRKFEADSVDWDLNKAVHMAVTKIENEVEHTFHTSQQHR